MTAAHATRPNRMVVELESIDLNFQLVRGLVGPDIEILPCLKNDAYGLSATDIARRLVKLGAGTIMSGTLDDAKAIRAAVPSSTKIVMFGGPLPEGIPALVENDLIPTCHTIEIAKSVSQAAEKPTAIYVKVDAGRGRLGLPMRSAEETILRMADMPKIVIEGIYTHLPFKNAEEMAWAQERTRAFNDLTDRLTVRGLKVPITQARSSSGLVARLEDRSSAVCPGRLLLGYPSAMADPDVAARFPPALKELRTQLIQISCEAGDTTPGLSGFYAGRVSGATGVIPIGRREGIAPARGDQTSMVVVNGIAVSVLSVSSELSIIDLSAVPHAAVGDDVVVLGDSDAIDLKLGDIACRHGMTPDEWLLSIRGRIPRFIVN